MRPYEIFNATFVWLGSADTRPWLIVQARPGNVFGCLPIASECYKGSCFEISDSHPDFPATGLAKRCHVHDEHIYDIPAANFGRRRGELTGELLADFKAFSGL